MKRDKLHLLHIRDALEKIEEYSKDFTFRDFAESDLGFDAVMMQIVVIGEMKFRMRNLKNKPEEEQKACFASYMAHLKWANSFGLRKSMAEQAEA